MDQKETSMTSVPKQPHRPRWRGHHTFAAAILIVGSMVFAYGGATAASTIVREPEVNVAVPELVTVADVSYLVTKDGELFSQGLNNNGQLGTGDIANHEDWTRVTFPGEAQPRIQKISSYGEHAIALDEAGALWTWGSAQNAAQGVVQDSPNVSPTRLTVSYSFSKLQTGNDFAVAVDARGALYSWGQNGSGQLGTGDDKARTGPTLIGGNDRFKDVAAGSDFAFAIASDNSLWAWGSNDAGQYGNGTKESSNKPVKVSNGKWKAVYPSRFSDTVLAIGADGKLYSWGSNEQGLLGNGRDWREDQRIENQRVKDEIAQIKVEDERAKQRLLEDKEQAVLNGLVADWQDNWNQWVLNSESWFEQNPEPRPRDFITPDPEPAPQPTPRPTPGATPTPQPTAPPVERDSEGLSEDDRARYNEAREAWEKKRADWLAENPEPVKPTDIGSSERARVAKEVEEEFEYTDTSGIKPKKIQEPKLGPESLKPVHIAKEFEFVSASVGSENAFAVDVLGRLWGWGNDKNGQTGLKLDEDTNTQVPVKLGETRFKAVFASTQWAVAVGDGGVYTWGLNDEARRLVVKTPKLNVPTKVSNGAYSRVAGSAFTGLAIREDGTASSWGANPNGYAGRDSKENIVEFGDVEGSYGSVGFAEKGVLSLSKSRGNLFFWGSDEAHISSKEEPAGVVLKPQRQVIPRFIDVAAGRLSTHVLDANGFVWTWGMSWMGSLMSKPGDIPNPTQVPVNARITALAANQTNVALITSSNEVLWWGSDSEGMKLRKLELPKGEEIPKLLEIRGGGKSFILRDEAGGVWEFSTNYPVRLSETKPGQLFKVNLPGAASYISAGEDNSAVIVDGVAYGWGENAEGQLIPKGELRYLEPTELPAPPGGSWKAISVSKTHTVAVSNENVLYGWGHTNYIGGLGALVEEPAQMKLEMKGE